MENSSIIERIKKVRDDHGLNQTDFSKKIGLSQNHYSNIEKGKKHITESFKRVICYEYGVNLDWLNSGQGHPYNQDNPFHSLKKTYNLSEENLSFIKAYCNNLNNNQRNILHVCMSGIK